MRLLPSLLASAALMGCSLAAHASTGTLFNISGTLSGNDFSPPAPPSYVPTYTPVTGSFSGTVLINTVSSLAISENITVSLSDGGSYTFNHSLPTVSLGNFHGQADGTYVNNGQTSVYDYQNGYQFDFGFLDPASGPYAGGALIAPEVQTFSANGAYKGSGTLVNPNALPVSAATPEPSSLILLGTGLLARLEPPADEFSTANER